MLTNRSNTVCRTSAPRCPANTLPRLLHRAVWSPTTASPSPSCTQVCRAQTVTELPTGLQTIVKSFQMVPDPMARYKQLLYYATKLPTLPDADHIPDNKVEGCVSQVWVKPQLRDDGLVYWSADSDSQLTKGLAALLVLGLSGSSPADIMKVEPDFIEMLGLKQSLTPSRNNGFLNMLRLMQRKAQQLALAAAGPSPRAQESLPLPLSLSDSPPLRARELAVAAAATVGTGAGKREGAAATATATMAPGGGGGGPVAPSASLTLSSEEVQARMIRKLTAALDPLRLSILDESPEPKQSRQASKLGVPIAAPRELHFRLEIVSPVFEGMNKVKRQRQVYQIVNEEFSLGLHALSLDTKAPSEL